MINAGVAAGDHQTAQAGVDVLGAGGNAVDAAIAAAFASWVVEPPLAAPGGGAVMLFGDPTSGFHVADGFSRVPGLGLKQHPLLDFQSVEVDYGPTQQAFHVGRGSVAVPTAIFALLDVHARAGRAPLRVVLEPATRLARDGWIVSPPLAQIMAMLSPILTHSEALRALLCVDGRVATAGTTLHNADLAGFFDRIVTDGPKAARAAFNHAMLDAFGAAQGGLITPDDLALPAVTWRAPAAHQLGDATVLLNPPPSSGGSLIAVGLAALSRDPHLAAAPAPRSAAHLRAVVDALDIVSRARGAGLDVALAQRDSALSESDLNHWVTLGARAKEERQLGSTTHLSVIDADGMVASLTMSNGEGCGHVLPGFGVHLNNFLGEEDINPAGFHVAPAGAAMSTMMCPTVVVRQGVAQWVLGTGGANRIRSALLQALVNHVLLDEPAEVAVNAPRLHVEGEHLWFEGYDLPADAHAALLKDHPEATIFDTPSMFFGGIHGVVRTRAGVASSVDRRRGGVFVPA